MGKYLYMAVTADDFELPIAVEDSAVALAERLGIDPMNVYNSIAGGRSGKISGHKLLKVKNL